MGIIENRDYSSVHSGYLVTVIEHDGKRGEVLVTESVDESKPWQIQDNTEWVWWVDEIWFENNFELVDDGEEKHESSHTKQSETNTQRNPLSEMWEV